MLDVTTDHGLVSSTLTTFVSLLAFATVVGVFAKIIRIPYTIALVLAGLAVAIVGAAPVGVVITQELVLVLLLPPLLFQAGLHLDIELLQKKAVPVMILAIPGVVLSTVLVAIAVRPFLGDFGWLPALLFGAMLAPTDPISVIATLKNAKAPHRLRTLIEGESLFNDGTGIVLFLILVAAVFTVDGKTTDLSFVNGIMQFVKVAGLGVVFGLGFGLSAFWILRRLNDHVLENAITIVLAWGSFIVAEQSGASGVIAVVVAGLIIGNYGTKLAMSDQTVQTINTFWESIDFLINSIVFLLIGFELQDIGGLSELLQVSVVSAVASVFIAILVARGVLVYPIAFILGRHWNKGWKHVVFWSGLKGSIPLALVLGLPDGELKHMLVPIAFGVVLVSLLLQGLTVGPLIRYLGVAGDDH